MYRTSDAHPSGDDPDELTLELLDLLSQILSCFEIVEYDEYEVEVDGAGRVMPDLAESLRRAQELLEEEGHE